MKILIVLFGLLVGVMLSAGDIILAEKGQAKAEIVIPAQPSVYVKFAAEELKQYLDKITGGNFKITSQSTAPVKIYLGKSPGSEAAGLKPETLKRDGFFINAKKKDIFIVGLDNPSMEKLDLFKLFYDELNRGTVLGVYEFLEQLGVRWPAPGSANEYVPKRPDLKISECTQKSEPFFADRKCLNAWNFMTVFPDAKEYCSNYNDAFLWGIRLKLSGRHMVEGCHSERSLNLKEVWADHPEHFALINGKRDFNYSCWTDPAIAEIWKKAADVYFSGLPPAEAGLGHLKPYLRSFWPCPFITKDDFMIDPMDHYTGNDGRCRCQRCNEFREKYPCADDSEIIWKVIAEVAESIKKKHPGKFISTLVYPPKMQLPKYTKIPDNVRVRICIQGPINIPTPNRLKGEFDLVKIWSDALSGNKPPLWTYQCEAAFCRKLPGMPEIYPHLTAEFLKKFRNDIAGMYIEQHGLTFTYINLDMYVASRLLWSPDQNVDDILTDYFKSYYGPAAEPAQKLFKHFEDNWVKYWKLATPDQPQSETIGLGAPAKELQKIIWSKIYDKDEMKLIDDMIAAVEKASEGNPVYSKRAGLLRKNIFDVMKMERAEVMDKEETRKSIVLQVPAVKNVPSYEDWKNAPAYNLVSASRLKPQLSAEGQFSLLSDGKTLYLKAELKEPELANSLSKKDRKAGDSNVWQDNDIEIFFYSVTDKKLWQIIVNDQGNWASQLITDKGGKWQQMDNFQVKVQPVPGGWSVEASIPLEPLGTGELRFNLTRSRQIKNQPNELSTWSSLAKIGNWHNPENYGTIFLNNK